MCCIPSFRGLLTAAFAGQYGQPDAVLSVSQQMMSDSDTGFEPTVMKWRSPPPVAQTQQQVHQSLLVEEGVMKMAQYAVKC